MVSFQRGVTSFKTIWACSRLWLVKLKASSNTNANQAFGKYLWLEPMAKRRNIARLYAVNFSAIRETTWQENVRSRIFKARLTVHLLSSIIRVYQDANHALLPIAMHVHTIQTNALHATVATILRRVISNAWLRAQAVVMT